MVGLDATTLHLIIGDSYWNWRSPDHFLRKTEIDFMQRKGATVEWA